MSTNVEKLQVNSTEFAENNQNSKKQSKDEVDFVRSDSYPPFKPHTVLKDGNHNNKITPPHNQCFLLSKKLTPGTLYGDCEVKTSIKSSLSTLEKLSLFNLAKKKMDPSAVQNTTTTTNTKEKAKFVKTPSLAKLLGNTYNTKKSENELMSAGDSSGAKNSLVNGAKRFGNGERFQKCSKEDSLNEVSLQDFREDKDLSAKAFRTISRSLGKLWWKRTHSVDISTPDPEYKVSYLGNVLTGWAKGEGCVEKPLNTLWRNYTQNHKPDVIMRVKICASGLKATTRQHGLTEYWANRITYCCAPQNYPKVFCWIYRHEGRKLKHELRCHAVLCSKESIAQEICTTLRENLDTALREFKREKISRQNARLSLANSVYENPSLPRRKILLSVGGNNYRPPLERSKSAPKLMAIEEAIGEEEGEETEETNEPEMLSCCQKDSFYPAMTLGRRRCRRGHSIRRTGKVSKSPNNVISLSFEQDQESQQQETATKETSQQQQTSHTLEVEDECKETTKGSEENVKTKSTSSLGSDEDDLEKLLSYHNYDSNSPLAGELLSYFDSQIKPKTSSLSNLTDETIIFEPSLATNPLPRSSLSLENLDNCGFDEQECVEEVYGELDYTDDIFFRESPILNLMHRNSLRRMANLSLNSDDNITSPVKHIDEVAPAVLALAQQQQHLDSDEGSISSGCETASTVTANMDDTSLKYTSGNHVNRTSEQNQGQQCDEPHQKIIPNDTHEIKICNATINFKLSQAHNSIKRLKGRGSTIRTDGDVSDSEFSDESGFVEFQEQNLLHRVKSVTV